MSSGFTQEKVDKLADLLLIGLTEEENKMVFEEFDVIDKNINVITEIDGIEKVIPMTHTLDNFECELREDIANESIPVDVALRNCDDVDNGEVSLVKVVG